ncbi:MAG TPA: prolipoprotein diacylglyceryl transferase [Spirochaetota bacterium]|nr:prolipoprotein diacylglyceryl transferase [Spirochaetota bacterium]HPQ53367.1 prolipoprotein diacylglyceryl transferase [Spirochaetota bacterium]
MFPILYQYKFISIGGYGVMLGLGFYLAFLLFERELKLRDIDPELAYKILLTAIPLGIIGSKVFHILEHLDDFARYPMEMIFSGAGLSAYGGFVFAFIGCAIVIKRSNEDILTICDAVAPSLALGYCFGRFGCHVAGDGCYGLIVKSYHYFQFTATPYPNGIVPTSLPVFPTPLFEVLFSFIAVGILLQMRRKPFPTGTLFFVYLLFNGVPRFLVEFIRLNPRMFLGLTQAQLVGILVIITGIIGLVIINKKTEKSA